MTTSFLLLLLVFGLGAGVVRAQNPAASIALQYVQDNAAALGLTAADVADVVVTDAYTTRHNGVSHVYLRQRYQGIDVYNALINVNVAADGRVLSLGNRFVPDLAAKITGATPGLTAAGAAEAAAGHVGLVVAEALTALETRPGPVQETVLNDGGISFEPIKARLFFQPLENGEVRLAWNVGIYARNGLNWWQVRVDAATGAELDRNDWIVSENWGPPSGVAAPASRLGVLPMVVDREGRALMNPDSYRVFPLPAESPNHPWPAGTPHTLVTDPWMDGGTAVPPGDGASPFGWHDTNGVAGAEFTDTQGNNVDAHTDLDANNVPDAGSRPDGGASLDFDFAANPDDPSGPGDPPSAYRPAAVVNLFYWNNIIHDITYQYGFDEVSGNFQENNYGRGGAGSDFVNADAQDGSGTCNANFGTPPDGGNPRMQMFICGNRDGDFDNGVIAHEYGHGISNRLTGGPASSGCLNNTEQMGEGWSDNLDLILTMQPGDAGPDARGIGTYLFGEDGDGDGIRPRPYSTDFAVNEFTYDNIKTASIPHGIGHVWATMTWDLTWALIGDAVQFPGLPTGDNGNGGGSGFNADFYVPGDDPSAGGNNLAHQLVMDGMKLQPCSPGFVDGRNAIIEADEAMTAGADGDWMTTDGQNARTIWTVFARRGLGWSADQGSSGSRSDGTEAFDLPPSLLNPFNADDTVLAQTVASGASTTVTMEVVNTDASAAHDLLLFVSDDPNDFLSIALAPPVGAAKALAPGDSVEVTVAAEDTAFVDVTFDAGALFAGVYGADLTLVADGTGQQVLGATLTVTGEPDIDTDGVTALDFGIVAQGSSAQLTVDVKNVGTDVLNVSSVAFDAGTDFTLAGGSTSFALAPGGTTMETLTVEFAPTGAGVFTDTLRIASDDPDEPEVEIPLDGLSPYATVSPETVEIQMQTDATFDVTVTLDNDALNPTPGLTFGAHTMAVPLAFGVTVAPDTGIVAAGGSQGLVLTLDSESAAPGDYQFELEIITDDPVLTTLAPFIVPVTMTVVSSIGASLSTPDEPVNPNEVFQLDVNIDADLAPFSVDSYQFDLTFNDSLITFLSVDTTGTLSSGLTVATSTAAASTTTLTVDADGVTPLSGSGLLIKLQMQALTHDIGPMGLVLDNFDFTPGTSGILPVADTSSVLEVVPFYGDASFDLGVDPFDGTLILRQLLGTVSLSNAGLFNADVSGDVVPYPPPTVDPFDGTLVLRFLLGTITCFPVDPACTAATAKQEALATTGVMTWSTPTTDPVTKHTRVALRLAEADGPVYGALIRTALDPDVARVTGLSPKLPPGWLVDYAVVDGELRIALFGTEALPGGEMLLLDLEWRNPEVPLSFASQVQVNSGPARMMAGATSAAVPAEFVLEQNYPNPFNPQTTITYRIAEVAPVRLAIYNLLGQRVRTLVAGEQQAGRYEVVWDGRSNAGVQVASGIYLYRLEAGSFVQTRRMTLLK